MINGKKASIYLNDSTMMMLNDMYGNQHKTLSTMINETVDKAYPMVMSKVDISNFGYAALRFGRFDLLKVHKEEDVNDVDGEIAVVSPGTLDQFELTEDVYNFGRNIASKYGRCKKQDYTYKIEAYDSGSNSVHSYDDYDNLESAKSYVETLIRIYKDDNEGVAVLTENVNDDNVRGKYVHSIVLKNGENFFACISRV